MFSNPKYIHSHIATTLDKKWGQLKSKKGNVLKKSDVTTTTFIVAEVTNESDTQRPSELSLLYLGGSGLDAPSWGEFQPWSKWCWCVRLLAAYICRSRFLLSGRRSSHVVPSQVPPSQPQFITQAQPTSTVELTCGWVLDSGWWPSATH